MSGWEVFTPCEAIGPNGEKCDNGSTESRPHGPQHYSDGWPLRKDGEPDRRYRFPVGPVIYWTDGGQA